MKLAGEPPADSPSRELLIADEELSSEDNTDDATAECPPDLPPAPVTVMSWNITELGGGSSAPVEREQVLIDAYAATIAAVAPTIVVIMDVRWGRKHQVVADTLDDGSTCLRYEPAAEHTGVAELDRIMAALGKADGGAKWSLLVPTDDAGGTVYHRGTTAALLYRGDTGLALLDKGVARGWDEPALGIGGDLHWAQFKVPAEDDTRAWTLSVAAPCHVMGERAVAEPSEDDPEEQNSEPPEPKGKLPDNYVLALSTDADLSRRAGGLAPVRGALGLANRIVPDRGTVLSRPYWEALAEANEFFVANPLGMNARDIHVHDDHMHWEAIALPDHPDEIDDVAGTICDQILACQGGDTDIPVIRELRVVDLVRAALKPNSPAHSPAQTPEPAPDPSPSEPQPEAEPLDEDGVLADRVPKLDGFSPVLDKARVDEDAPDDPNREARAELHVAYDFVRRLSDHWPLLATLCPDP